VSKRALGKGLDALLFTQQEREDDASQKEAGERRGTPAADEEFAKRVVQVDIKKIKPNPQQPRRSFHEETLQELAESIKERGVIQPVLAEKKGEEYVLVAGERRLRAARIAGLEQIPVLAVELTEGERLEIALIENIQRDNLTPLEEANAYSRLMKQAGLNQEELADRVGKKRSTVANSLRLLKLPKPAQEALQQGTITSGHARAILAVSGKAEQEKLLKEIVDNALSVREAEKAALEYNRADAEGGAQNGLSGVRPGTASERNGKVQDLKSKSLNPELLRIEEELIELFGTKVSVRGTLEGGKLEISYFSMDDLERIYDIIIKRKKSRS
jgi:ParB family transcriptional regulator, chromosome partitioning protein